LVEAGASPSDAQQVAEAVISGASAEEIQEVAEAAGISADVVVAAVDNLSQTASVDVTENDVVEALIDAGASPSDAEAVAEAVASGASTETVQEIAQEAGLPQSVVEEAAADLTLQTAIESLTASADVSPAEVAAALVEAGASPSDAQQVAEAVASGASAEEIQQVAEAAGIDDSTVIAAVQAVTPEAPIVSIYLATATLINVPAASVNKEDFIDAVALSAGVATSQVRIRWIYSDNRRLSAKIRQESTKYTYVDFQIVSKSLEPVSLDAVTLAVALEKENVIPSASALSLENVKFYEAPTPTIPIELPFQPSPEVASEDNMPNAYESYSASSERESEEFPKPTSTLATIIDTITSYLTSAPTKPSLRARPQCAT